MKKLLTTSALLLSMVQASVNIHSTSYQEEAKITPTGEKTKEWVKASKVVPGTVVRYVNSLENAGTKSARKLVVKNPIPKSMEYVENSASCQNGCTMTYSVDGGKNYNNAEALYVGVGENRRLAKASEYTDIQWIVDSLLANTQSTVEYKARLK